MFCFIRTPFYITCWILLLLNLNCTWPCRAFSLLFILCIVLGRRILILLFLHLCCMCMWQNPSAAFLHFWCTLHNVFFTGSELQVQQNRDGMHSPVHLFDQQTCIWYKKWETTNFYCESSAATLKSLLPARKVARDKGWLSLTWVEKVKREKFREPHFFNRPYWLLPCYWSDSVNFTKWIINFSLRKSFWTKTSS